jgi:hypothetical protein
LDGPAAAAALAGDAEAAERLAREGFETAAKPRGRIVFVIAPAHSDQLSLAAARALARAEILVAAEGVAAPILGLVRREAEHRPEATPPDWLRWAEAGALIVRLGPFNGRELDAVGGQAEVLHPAPI